MKKYVFILVVLICVTGSEVFGQTINGRIISETERIGLMGVTIKAEEAKATTTTDSSGFFTIKLPPGMQSLSIHLIGFAKQKVKINSSIKQFLTIVLQPETTQLNEVKISTGYEIIPKVRSTGSFSLIERSKLEQQVSTNIMDRLESVAGGLMINKAQNEQGSLSIRGLSTITGPKTPLIILNNFPYDGDLSNINPNDVASITILKDAAAASIWGTRAGNGVVVITTKKANFNEDLKVNFSTNIGITIKPNLTYMPLMNSSDFIDVEKMLFAKGFYKSKINAKGTALSPVVEMLVRNSNNQLSDIELNTRINELKNIDVRDEYKNLVYNNGLNNQYSLNLSSGSENTKWLITSGFDDNKSVLSEKYKRFTLGFENAIVLFKKLTLNSALKYTKQDKRNGKQGYGSFSSAYNELYPYAVLKNKDGSPAAFYQYRQSYLETLNSGKLLNWLYYPIEDYKHLSLTSSTQDIITALDLTYNIFKGITISGKYQYENQIFSGQYLKDKESYAARDLINSFTQIDSEGNVSYNVPKGGIMDKDYSRIISNQVRAQMNYDNLFGQHEIHALIGTEFKEISSTRELSKLYGYSKDLMTFGNVDLNKTYPNFITGRSSYIPSGSSINKTELYYISQFLNLAYTYDGKYTLSGSARQDATNLFGVNVNDLWNPLWSAGFSWQLDKEEFYRFDFLPLLKLRATYGFSGNADPSRSAVTTIEYQENSPYTQSPYAVFSQFGNPDLKWETVRTINFGIDFSTKNNRINGSLEYFRKRSTDLFGNSPLDPTAGSGTDILKNSASMKGSGFDIQLETDNLKGKLNWTTNWNISYYSDKVTKYYLSDNKGSNFMTGVIGITGKVGFPVYSLLSYKWAGLDPQTGAPQGFSGGEVSKDYAKITGPNTKIDDLRYWGSAIPKYYGNIGNTISWKQFSLTLAVSFKLGYYFRKPSIEYNNLYVNGRGHKDFEKRWQNPGDELLTNVPAMVYPAPANRDAFYKYSDVLVEKADHIRFQYLNLGFSPDQQLFKRQGFRNVNFYMNITNLGLIWTANDKNIDPDYSRSQYSYPSNKTITFGLRAGF